MIVFVVRLGRFCKTNVQSKEYHLNIIDLKALYEGDVKELKKLYVQSNPDRPILLAERDVDCDLLNIEKIIDYLYQAIVSTNPAGKIVIGLEGSWGIGKLKIIKNVIKKIGVGYV